MTTGTYWHDHRDELVAQISRLSGADALLILQALARCTSETQIAPTLIGMVQGTLAALDDQRRADEIRKSPQR